MKIVRTVGLNAWAVVADDYGAIRCGEDGRQRLWLPLAYCRVPIGENRTIEQARQLAERICQLLTDSPIS